MRVSIVCIAAAVLLTTGGWALAQNSDAAAREDARQERQAILRAADQLDMQQKTIESLQAQVAELRTLLNKLQQENASLRADLVAMGKTVEGAAAERAEEQKVLLAQVTKIIKEAAAKSAPATPDKPTAERGFYHVVEEGQTLSLIAKAYRDQGVKVTVEQIREANGIGTDNVIRVGQKLFIPKS